MNDQANKDRAVVITINNRCPLRCRHCSVGFSETNRGTDAGMSAAEIAEVIAAIDGETYKLVAFAGGEPSLNPELLRCGIAACRKKGVRSAIITAPVWAKSFESACRFLQQIEGIGEIIVSLDRHHLEFLKFSHYENALLAAYFRNVARSIYLCFGNRQERDELLARIDGFRSIAGLGEGRIVPVGNAATHEPAIEGEYTTVTDAADFARIPRSCVLGTVYVDSDHTVHGCCWSKCAKASPFSVPTGPGGLAEGFRRLETMSLFRSVRNGGFIDGLSAAGREALLAKVRGGRFTNECHLCITAMNTTNGEVWKQFT